MKLASCEFNGNQSLAVIDAPWNQLENGCALLLAEQPQWPRGIETMQALIEGGGTLNAIAGKIASQVPAEQWLPLSKIQLLAPIPVPNRNIICLGWNYAEHACESSAAKEIQVQELPQYPIVFTKATTTVNGPFADIVHDSAVSRRLDWEVELGVVIGKQGRHISVADAIHYVFGYTVINDVSARDLQKRHQQFFLGKSVDGTCPMGPWIVTSDDIQNPQNLDLQCKVNGVTKQHGNTRQQIFDVATTISILSKAMTLLPGDIIATGTPSGVGFARTPPEYLQIGDVVQCEVEDVGVIRNTIVTNAN